MRTNIGLRNRIIRLYNKLHSYKKVEAEFNGEVSYYQIWNAVNKRVKTDYSSRTDKGLKRNADPDEVELKLKFKTPDDFDCIADFLEHQLMITLWDLSIRKYAAGERTKILKDIALLQKNIQLQKLEAWIKSPEANLIINMMRRSNPKLSDEDILKIYQEELDKHRRNLRDNSKI